jgi:sulfur dioxygenase
MIFRQLFDTTSSTYTYLIAGRRGGEALIVDPVLERVDRYIKLLDELDVKLVKAIDTHLHADHITGLGALRDRTQCVTMMGEQSDVDVVSVRIIDGDVVAIGALDIKVVYTPGHTQDSYSFLMDDRVFTGDTLFIRGTGRTDFQQGDAAAQYDSLFNKLLKLPDDTLVYPGHDYKGDTVSTIGEEKRFNPRLQVNSVEEYVHIMDNLNLQNPKMMDVAVPANMHIGMPQDEVEKKGRSVDVGDAAGWVDMPEVLLADLREHREREQHGVIAGSVHTPYSELSQNLKTGGMLYELIESTQKQLLFYCAYGERSAMAVKVAQEAGLENTKHIKGGMDAWKNAGLPVQVVA